MAKIRGDLYILDGSALEADTAITRKRSTAKIWHERLGHLNMNVSHMSKTQAVSGLILKENQIISDCKVCIAQKFISLPFTLRIH